MVYNMSKEGCVRLSQEPGYRGIITQVQGFPDIKGRPNGGTMNPDSLAVLGTRVGGPIQEP